jgi:hypothetical protein
MLLQYDGLWNRPFSDVMASTRRPRTVMRIRTRICISSSIRPTVCGTGSKKLASSEIGAGVCTADTDPDEKPPNCEPSR